MGSTPPASTKNDSKYNKLAGDGSQIVPILVAFFHLSYLYEALKQAWFWSLCDTRIRVKRDPFAKHEKAFPSLRRLQ